MANRERLIESGWKQGILLVPNDEHLKESAHYEIPDNARLLIVSQTCDLVQGSFEREPYFEVLCLHPLDQEPDGGYLGGKNSRRIEFSIDLVGDGITHWYALPYKRHLINRELLLDDLKSGSLLYDEQTLNMILRWLSRRYTRVAFPEEFIKRIGVRKKQIGKKFSDLNSLVSNVFVKLVYEEFTDGQLYDLEVILLMKSTTFDDKNQYKRCGELKDQLEYQLNQCKGINVTDINIESGADLPIEGLNGFREWDYSYLSFREPDEAAMPVDI